MIEVRQTIEFSDWLHRLKDVNAVARIAARIRRMELGNPGDARSVDGGVMELRIAFMVQAIASITCIVAARS